MEHKDEKNIYGSATKGNLARIRRRSIRRQDALEYDHNEYCLPFNLRLCLKLEDLGMLEGVCPDETQIGAYIMKKAAQKGLSLRYEWFAGNVDPGEFRDSDSTRMNIYALCAALDADYYETAEIFQKVFFKCPFLPKRRMELIFYYFAKKAMERREYGSDWYFRALELSKRMEGKKPKSSNEPIRLTRKIFTSIDALDESGFERFLEDNGVSFTDADPLNEFVSARIVMRELTEECWRHMCRENPDDMAFAQPFSVQYDTLVDGILGIKQRGSTASVSVSELKLPKQLLSCFPTGKILGDILGRDSEGSGKYDANMLVSLDELSKMMVLLLFYYYFSECRSADEQLRFDGFVTMANDNLAAVGLNYIYPGQPYGSFILYHAAADDPIGSLREFMQTALSRAAEDKLTEQLMLNLPDCTETQCRAIVDGCAATPFYVRLCAFLVSGGLVDAPRLLHSLDSEMPEESLLRLCERLDMDHKCLLGGLSLLPRTGISQRLAAKLLPGLEGSMEEKLCRSGLLTDRKGLYVPDSELGRFMRQLLWQYDELRAELARRAMDMADDRELAASSGVHLAALLAAIAPKLEYFRRADTLLKASQLYAEAEDEKSLKKALDCAQYALEQQKRFIARRGKKSAGGEISGATLKNHYLNLEHIYRLMGLFAEAQSCGELAAGC